MAGVPQQVLIAMFDEVATEDKLNRRETQCSAGGRGNLHPQRQLGNRQVQVVKSAASAQRNKGLIMEFNRSSLVAATVAAVLLTGSGVAPPDAAARPRLVLLFVVDGLPPWQVTAYGSTAHPLSRCAAGHMRYDPPFRSARPCPPFPSS